MGLDSDFIRTKKIADKLGKNVNYPDLEGIERYEIIYLRKNYGLDEGIREKTSWYADYINLSKDELEEILKEFESKYYKRDYKLENDKIRDFREAINTITIILRLFDFEKYDLWYTSCS